MRTSLLLLTVCLVPSIASAETKESPNILFAIADDWGTDHAGAYGCKWVKTPAFDRVARDGILFTRAYVPNAKCAPCRAALLTGRNSWQLEQACNHICFFPPRFRSYPEALGANGYFVGCTGKGWGPGVAKTTDGKQRQMTGTPFNRRKKPSGIRGISPNDYAGNFEAFLEAAPKGKPWCFWYGATEPHRGFQPGIGRKMGKKLTDIDRVPGYFPDNETVRNDLLDYSVEVEHYDNHLGSMLALLEKTGQLDNTLVIVTSDHGMPFPRCKGQSYDPSHRVPLAIMWKNGIAKPGRTVTDYVSLIDIAPTIIEATGRDWAKIGMKPTPGKSLFDIFRSTKQGQVTANRDHVLMGKERHDIGRPNDWGYPVRSIAKGDFLYIRNYEPTRWPACNPETGYLNCDGSPTKTLILERHRMNPKDKYWRLCFGKRPAEELYDLRNDPDCINNLALDPKHAKRKRELEAQLVRELKEQGDPRMFGKGSVFEKYTYSNAGTRNFHERYMKGEKLRAGWANPTDFEKKPIDEPKENK